MMRSCENSLRLTSPDRFPSHMTIILSQTPISSGISDEIMMTALPCCTNLPSSRYISRLAPTSMPRVGSSKIMISGSLSSHFAMTTFCWLPPDRFPTIWSPEGVLIFSFSMYSLDALRALFLLYKPLLRSLRIATIAILSLTVLRRFRPVPFRSSVMSATPSLIISCGE